MDRKHVVIVGASARAAAWSLRWAGHFVTAIDLFADQDLSAAAHRVLSVDATHYPENLLPIIQHMIRVPDQKLPPLDALLFVGGLENHPRLLDQFRFHLPVWGPDSAELDQLRDPLQWMPRLAQLGWRCPACLHQVPTEDVRSAYPAVCREGGDHVSATALVRWLFKPYRSSGGRRIDFVQRLSQPPRERGYLQQFVPGPSYAGIFLSTPGANHVCGVTRQWVSRDVAGHSDTTSDPFAYVGSVSCALDVEQRRHWEAMADALLAGAKPLGLWGIDAIDARAENGTINEQREFTQLVPIEVNPRYTASVEVLERVRGASWLQDHLEVFASACHNKSYQPVAEATHRQVTTSPRPTVWGKRILFAPSNIAIDDQTLKSVRNLCRQARPRLRFVDIPTTPQDIERGRPIFTLLASGHDRSEVECQLGLTEPSASLARILDRLDA